VKNSVKIIKLELVQGLFNSSDIPRFRQYLAEKFPNYDHIHNHLENGKFRYVYPDIQFKIINKIPMIIGFGDGIEILKDVFLKVDEMKILNKNISIFEKSIKISESKIGISDEIIVYKFLSPWMALNQQNYELYKKLSLRKRVAKLDRILWGNLKTVSHAFDYWILDPDKISTEGDLKLHINKFKGNTMITFTGKFKTNFHIPDYLGIGKQVARGFGSVVKIHGGEG